MLEPSKLAVFLVATLALLLTPGPSVLYITARSIDQGRQAGLVSVLGVGIGTLFHITAAALGLSALLLSSALAFNVVKYLGAAYLIYLGIRKLLGKDEAQGETAFKQRSLRRVFIQGIVVNILNPKTALFFFAFLPQFVDPTRGSVALQIFTLGLIFAALGLMSDGMYAVLAGSIGGWLKRNPTFMRRQRFLTGGIYVALGLTAALAGNEKK
jgi:threonine/homoserine/homoserine lactone efflux protein